MCTPLVNKNEGVSDPTVGIAVEAIAEMAIRADEPAIDLLHWRTLHDTSKSTPVLASFLESVNSDDGLHADLVGYAPTCP